MTRAYCEPLAGLFRAFIQTPRGTWVELKSYGRSREEIETWLSDMGYQIISKEDSFKLGQ